MFGPTDFAVIEARIVQAHYELTQQSGFLRYFDPNVAAVATRFCPTRDQSAAGNCTAYPGVTFYSDRVVTEAGYVQTGDVLSVDKDVSGDLNPNLAVRGATPMRWPTCATSSNRPRTSGWTTPSV
jgi:hypothetical protein